MPKKHPPVALEQLRSPLGTPRAAPWRVDLNEPAKAVMTDFTQRNMVTVDVGIPVDAALEVMRHAGVRAAFVIDAVQGRVLGLVTAHDIMGEKPIRFLQSIGCTHTTCSRDDVKVGDVMERAEEWTVARMVDVEPASVGDMLDALERAGRTHLPVVEAVPGREPTLRGVFSRAKLLRLTEESRRAGAPATGRAAG
jgi:CBS domain-containing protein